MQETEHQNHRGKLLTTMLVIRAVLIAVSLPAAFNGLELKYFELPKWWNGYLLTEYILGIIAIVGIYKWKKWAACLAIVIAIAGTILSQLFASYAPPANTDTQLTDISYMIGGSIIITMEALWLWAIIRKWKYFK